MPFLVLTQVQGPSPLTLSLIYADPVEPDDKNVLHLYIFTNFTTPKCPTCGTGAWRGGAGHISHI